MRIQSGMHGPTLVLPDDPELRASLDAYELEIREGYDNSVVLLIRKNGRHSNTIFLERGDL